MIKYTKSNNPWQLALSLLVITGLIAISSCKNKKKWAGYKLDKNIVADSSMVVSAHPVASEIALEILKAGGNAVDAAIACQFALAVCYPIAGNIGGGGFMIYKELGKNPIALDFREKAPLAAHPTMYQNDKNEVIKGLSVSGALASGVPGTVAGMASAYKRFSKLKDWKKLIAPSIKIANEGFRITERQAFFLNRDREKFLTHSSAESAFTKQKWNAGNVLIQKELANTLEHIMNKGENGFYVGDVAHMIIDEINKGAGIITKQDLSNYTAKWRTPIHTNYRGYDVYSMPPPSSGGIALAQLLEIIEPYNFKDIPFHSVEHIHLLVEAERRVYADRSKHLGDSDFYEVPIKMLLDSSYLQKVMANFNLDKASESNNIEAGVLFESNETTHFSIIDLEGNTVALTTTINGAYGSHTVVDGAGFLLNNEMDDFSLKSGTPNLYGLIGAEANKIESEKRMLSSMTPTIVTKDGEVIMALGTPGGSTIITSIFQVINNVIDYQMSPSDAVLAFRFHHQWLPDKLRIEESHTLSEPELDQLKSMGHTLNIKGKIGKVELIFIDKSGMLHGAADTRADDDIAAY